MKGPVGICPYCLKFMTPIVLKKNIIRRNKYKCTKCLKEINTCVSWGCYNYVRTERWNKYCKPCVDAATLPTAIEDYWTTDTTSDSSSFGDDGGGGDGGGGGD